MKTVYLAGPILGCDYERANEWRQWMASQLDEMGVKGISPLRCEPLHGEIYEEGSPCPKFGTAKAIGAKNVFDVRQCDMTLAFIPKPPEGSRHSWGTMCELAGAFFLGKQSILVSADPAIRNHPVLSAMAGWVLEDLSDALDVIEGVLGAYAPGGKNV